MSILTSNFEQLPYVERFLSHLETMNEFLSPRAILRYQLEILQTGGFALPSPWTGKLLRPVDCYVANNSPLGFGDIVIAYRLQCEETVWVIAGIVKEGFPINEVFIPALDVSPWYLHPDTEALNENMRGHLRFVDDPGRQGPAEAPVLLLGHPNFAHTIWNELPGLAALRLFKTECVDNLQVMTLCQPILDYEEEFSDLGFEHCTVRDVTDVLGLQPRVFTRIGSTQVTELLRTTLLKSLRRGRNSSITCAVERQLEHRNPVVWVSVRLDSRTASNQEEFVVAAITAIAAHYPAAAFILDGFSFPNDFDNPIYRQSCGAQIDGATLGIQAGSVSSLGEMLAAREREVSAYIVGLQQALTRKFRNPVVSTSGLNMTDATYIGSLAHYYVCHAGTLQHKIGWVHNSAGIVHSNTEGVGAGAAGWMAKQVENGLLPAVIDQSLIHNLSSIRSLNQVERNRDYQIADVTAAVSQVMNGLAQRMSEPGSGYSNRSTPDWRPESTDNPVR